MNELIKVEELLKGANVKKAEINLPIDLIKTNVESYIQNFKGLVYTDENIKDAKEDRAKLNKLKKNLNDFGVKTEKALTQDVKQFRSDLKEVIELLESPLNDIDVKVKQYEEEQRNLKLIFVKDCITKLAIESELDVEDYEKIETKSEYLNASTSKKKIEEDILSQIKEIKLLKEKRILEEKQIKQQVQVKNLEHQLNVKLQENAYVNMLHFKEFDEICNLIDIDAKRQKNSEIAYAQKIKEQEEAKAKEAIKKAEREAEEKAKIEIEVAKKKAEDESKKIIAEEKAKTEATLKATEEAIEQVTNIIPNVVQENEQMYKATFKVRGSKDQLEKLVNYFNMSEIEWEKL